MNSVLIVFSEDIDLLCVGEEFYCGESAGDVLLLLLDEL
jgi:hypothetical protein